MIVFFAFIAHAHTQGLSANRTMRSTYARKSLDKTVDKLVDQLADKLLSSLVEKLTAEKDSSSQSTKKSPPRENINQSTRKNSMGSPGSDSGGSPAIVIGPLKLKKKRDFVPMKRKSPQKLDKRKTSGDGRTPRRKLMIEATDLSSETPKTPKLQNSKALSRVPTPKTTELKRKREQDDAQVRWQAIVKQMARNAVNVEREEKAAKAAREAKKAAREAKKDAAAAKGTIPLTKFIRKTPPKAEKQASPKVGKRASPEVALHRTPPEFQRRTPKAVKQATPRARSAEAGKAETLKIAAETMAVRSATRATPGAGKHGTPSARSPQGETVTAARQASPFRKAAEAATVTAAAKAAPGVGKRGTQRGKNAATTRAPRARKNSTARTVAAPRARRNSTARAPRGSKIVAGAGKRGTPRTLSSKGGKSPPVRTVARSSPGPAKHATPRTSTQVSKNAAAKATPGARKHGTPRVPSGGKAATASKSPASGRPQKAVPQEHFQVIIPR